MKKIIKNLPNDCINIENVPDEGIIGVVYKNKLSILRMTNSTFSDSKSFKSHKFYFNYFNIISCDDIHSASETMKEAIMKNIPYNAYYFENLQDLCKAVIKNGWK